MAQPNGVRTMSERRSVGAQAGRLDAAGERTDVVRPPASGRAGPGVLLRQKGDEIAIMAQTTRFWRKERA